MKHTPVFITVFLFLVMSLLICCSYAGDSNQPQNTSTEASYKVEYYQQNITDDDYTLVESDTEILKGISGSLTVAAEKSYDGFTAKKINQETIKSDNSTVVKIYYDRKIFKLSFDTDGGTSIDDISVKYGAPIVPPVNPTKAGYYFINWNPELPQTMPLDGFNTKAVWLKEGITISLPEEDADKINLTLTLSDKTGAKICTASSITGATYKWLLDGTLLSGKTGNVLELNYSKITKGYHSVLVVVELDGKSYTKIDSFNYID